MSTIKTLCDVTVAGLDEIAASCSPRSSEFTAIAPAAATAETAAGAGALPPGKGRGEAESFHAVISFRHVSSEMYTTLLSVNFQRGRPSVRDDRAFGCRV